MQRRVLNFGLLVPMLLVGSAAANEIGWPEAVAVLASERTQAMSCAAMVKAYGEAADIDRGGMIYSKAKAEADAVIAGLVVALAEDGTPAALQTLTDRLAVGTDQRLALCALAGDVSPFEPELYVLDFGALGELIEAVATLLNAALERREERDRLTIATITTQLEATRWLDYAAIPTLGLSGSK